VAIGILLSVRLFRFLFAYLSDIQVYDQAIKDVGSNYDAVVDLLQSIEHFLSRLQIYTELPPTAAMRDIVVKIMVELLYTIALVTKQIRQSRPCECVPTSESPDSMRYSEIGKEDSRRE
jgi:hypothetical protein